MAALLIGRYEEAAHLCVADDASAEAPPRGPKKRRTEVAMVLCTSLEKGDDSFFIEFCGWKMGREGEREMRTKTD